MSHRSQIPDIQRAIVCQYLHHGRTWRFGRGLSANGASPAPESRRNRSGAPENPPRLRLVALRPRMRPLGLLEVAAGFAADVACRTSVLGSAAFANNAPVQLLADIYFHSRHLSFRSEPRRTGATLNTRIVFLVFQKPLSLYPKLYFLRRWKMTADTPGFKNDNFSSE